MLDSHSRTQRLGQAVVLFDDELTWPAATDLVDIVDLMVHGYFYRRIEIVIASSGGLTLAFDHYLAALQRWRAAGVWITTRVVSRAQSAAALMLSISDERIAEPSARLFYHQARSFTSEPLTVSATAELHDDLRRLESQHIDLLVDRAFAADPSLLADSDPCDRRVLELLGPRVHSGGARRPRSARGALTFLAHTVQRALKDPRSRYSEFLRSVRDLSPKEMVEVQLNDFGVPLAGGLRLWSRGCRWTSRSRGTLAYRPSVASSENTIRCQNKAPIQLRVCFSPSNMDTEFHSVIRCSNNKTT